MAYSNSNLTSRIVVGFGLAAACAIGVSIFSAQARQQMANQAAFNAATQSLADSSAASGVAGPSGQEFSAPPAPTEPAVIQPAAQPDESPAVAAPKPGLVKATRAKAAKEKKPMRVNRDADVPVDAGTAAATGDVPAAPAASVPPSADAFAPPDGSPPAAAPVDAPVDAPALAQHDTAPAAAAPAVADPTTLIDNGQQPQ